MGGLSNLPREQAMALAEALRRNPALVSLANAKPAVPGTEAGAVAMCSYKLGEGILRAAPAGALVTLAYINSPLLGDIDRMTEQDVYRALYAIGGGIAALRPMMGREQRILEIDRMADQSKSTAELWGAYLNQRDRIVHEAWTAFDEAALKYAETFGTTTPQDVLNVCLTVACDALAGLGMVVRVTDGEAEKKTALDSQTAANGSGRFWQWLRLVLGLIRARLAGTSALRRWE